jgi:hypothetical protein
LTAWHLKSTKLWSTLQPYVTSLRGCQPPNRRWAVPLSHKFCAPTFSLWNKI